MIKRKIKKIKEKRKIKQTNSRLNIYFEFLQSSGIHLYDWQKDAIKGVVNRKNERIILSHPRKSGISTMHKITTKWLDMEDLMKEKSNMTLYEFQKEFFNDPIQG